jgi:CheY-like chemotaxis protein
MSDTAKVLIADDEQPCIDFVREALADTPCEVIAAMDGEEALEIARRENPQVIILDVEMPKLGGFEVFGELRADENLASVPVIMLTGVKEKSGIEFSGKDMGDFIGAEPNAYIDKPIEPIILKQVVTHLLNQSGAAE